MTAVRLVCGLPRRAASDAIRWGRQNEPALRVLRIPSQKSGYPPSVRDLCIERATVRIDHFPQGCPLDQIGRTIASACVGRPVQHLSLFLSPAGGTTPAHYDANDVLVVQLRGSKTAVVASQATVSDPREDALLADWGPGDAQIFQLERGDGLLIPKGYAHQTWSTRTSLTLGIGLA